MGRFSWLVALGIGAATWIAASVWVALQRRLQARGWRNWRLPRAFVGMLLAHLGVAVFIVGVTLVLGYATEKDVRVAPGEQTAIAGYTLQFAGTHAVTNPVYTGQRGTFTLARNGQQIDELHPAKRLYTASGDRTTEAAIHYSLAGDIYVSLGSALNDGAWAVRLYHKPFVEWIWAGCLLMALGGFTALSDKRYRIRVAERKRKRRSARSPQPSRTRPAG